MQILTESYGYLNEAEFVKIHDNAFQSIFKKVDIYNKRKQQYLNENRYNEILFTLNEQEAINDMFSYIQNKILENYINELGWSDIKNATAKTVDKTKTAISNTVDALKNAPEKIKKAYAFCEKILKCGITKVSDFINKLIELLSELGDNLHDAILSLGGFGKDAITEAENIILDNPLSHYQGDEKEFLQNVIEYVQTKQNTNESYFTICSNEILNENAFLDKMQATLDKHPVMSKILFGQFKGKKISWWKTILISIVGSILLGTVLPMIIPVLGVGIAGSSISVATILVIAWGGRGVLKSLLHRNALIKENGEKFWNWKFTLLILLQSSVIIVTQIPAVKEFLAHFVESAFKALHIDQGLDWCKDKIGELFDKIKGDNTDFKTINDTLATAAPSDTTPKVMTFGKSGLKSFKDYINTKVFGENGLFADFKMNTDGLKKWADEIYSLNANGSSTTLNNSLPTLSDKDPMTFIIDGNTFKHIDRQELLKAVEKAGGRIFNYGNAELMASTNNMAGSGLTISFDCLPTQTNIDEVYNILNTSCESLKDAGVDTLIKCQNEILNISNDAVKSATDVIDIPFNGFAIEPIFTGNEVEKIIPKYLDKFNDKIKVSFGSEAKKYVYIRVSNMKHINNEELKKDLSNVKSANDEGINIAKDRDEKNVMIITNSTEKIQQNVKEDKKENKKVDIKGVDTYVENVNKFTNINEHKCIVFYTNKTIDNKKVEIPILAINYNTLQCIDLVNSKKLGTRKYPYFLKGLFNKLTFKPIDEQDAETKKRITEFLLETLVTGIKDIAYKNAATVFTYDKNKKYIPVEGINAEDNRLELGNFSNKEICEILNDNKQVYKYFDGIYAEDIKGVDDNGIATKSHKRGTNIEDKDGYVEKAIWPVISNPKTDVNKDIKADETIRKYKKLFTKDGELSDVIYKFNPIKNALFRSPSTYEDVTGSTIADNLRNSNKDSKDIEIKVAAIQHLAEIIWKYKGSRSEWGKQQKKAGLQPEKIKEVEQEQAKKDEQYAKEYEDKKDKVSKDKSTSSTNNDSSIINTEITTNFAAKKEWFEKTFIKRLDNKNKTLYKQFCRNEKIQKYYKLDEENHNINNIKKDNFLIAIMYTRYKAGKMPTPEFWTKKLPEQIVKLYKNKLNKEYSLDNAKEQSLVYKEIYLIMRSYTAKMAPDRKKEAWKRFLDENKQFKNAKKLFEHLYN